MPAKKIIKKTVKKPAKKIAKKILKKSVVKFDSKIVKKNSLDYSKVMSPLGEKILVRLQKADTVTAGGLIIPNSADVKSSYLKAVVLAVGKGLKTKKGYLKPLDVKIGDLVLFQRHVSIKVEFKLNSQVEELYILNESNVLGIA